MFKFHKFSAVTITRRLSQCFIFVIFVLSPVTQLVRTFRQDPYPYLQSPIVLYKDAVRWLMSVDNYWRDVLDPFYSDISGGPYSLHFFGLHFAEPLTAFTSALRVLWSPGQWSFELLWTCVFAFAMIFVLGRIYCSFICPMSWIAAVNLKIQQRFFGRQAIARPEEGSRIEKGLVIYRYLVVAIVAVQPLILQFVLPPALMQHAWSDWVLFGGGSLWLLLLLGVIALEFASPTLFCRFLCPSGLFVSALSRFRLFGLGYVRKVKCPEGCESCNAACWLGLTPKSDLRRMASSACDSCHRCVSVCPESRLRLFRIQRTARGFTMKYVLLIAFFASFQSYGHVGVAGQWDAQDSYVADILEYSLDEGRLALAPVNGLKKRVVTYSFMASQRSRDAASQGLKKSLQAWLLIHIGDEKNTSIGPITVQISDQKQKIHFLKTVNYPISIVTRSVYQIPFMFFPSQRVLVKVHANDQAFPDFEIQFSYPEKRF